MPFCEARDFTPVVPLKNDLNQSKCKNIYFTADKTRKSSGIDDHTSHKIQRYNLSQICVLLTGWAEL